MIRHLAAAHSVQSPVGITPKLGRQATDTTFTQQLSGALKQYLTSAGIDPNKATIGISPATSSGAGQTNGAAAGSRQLLVTVSGEGADPRAAPNARATTGPVPPGVTPRTPVAVPVTVEMTPDGKPLPPSLGPIHIIQPKLIPPVPQAAKAPRNESERYWASQPKAVQALQDIEDPTARKLKAWDLAIQGYTIDVPIMVWGWDPQYTMELRKNYGYTWVPSALQDTVKIAPGLQMPGVTPYDPNNPPPGSIRVNTDFV